MTDFTHPKAKGDRTEAVVLAEFVKLGVTVLLPWGENTRYDLVFEIRGRFFRVQTKTGRLRNGRVLFNSVSSTNHHRNGATRGYVGEADFFAVWCPDCPADVFLIPVAVVGLRGLTLRVDATRNNQSTDVKWARDYTIQSAVEALLAEQSSL